MVYSLFDFLVDVSIFITLLYFHYIVPFLLKARRVFEYERIVHEFGFNVRVYLLDFDIPNALVLGFIPGTEYILVLGRLEKWFTHNEIRAILAHELGHVRDHPYTWPLVTIIVIDIAKIFIPKVTIEIPYAIPLTLIYILCIFLIATPTMCRLFEKRADIFAAKLVGKELYINTLVKVHKLLGHVEKIPKTIQILLTHPDLQTRIKTIQKHA